MNYGHSEAQNVQKAGCGCGSARSLKTRRLQAATTGSRRNHQKSIKTRFL